MSGDSGEFSQPSLNGMPFEQAFTPEEQQSFANVVGFTLQETIEIGEMAQIGAFKRVAGQTFDSDGDEILITKSLDAAIAVVDTGDLGNTISVREYEEIAKTAHATGQSTGYVRSILDKAKSAIEQDMAEQPSRHFHIARLRTLAKFAHATGQDADYIKPIFTPIREAVMDGLGSDPRDFSWRVDGVVREADKYGLGEEYVKGVLDEARSAAHELPEIEKRVKTLGDLAVLSFKREKDPEYTQDTLADAELTVMQEVNNIPERVALLTHLAKIAHTTGQVEELTVLPMGVTGFEVVSTLPDSKTFEEQVQLARCMRQIVETLFINQQAEIAHEFIADGIDSIMMADVTPRARHMLLNASLGDIELPETFLDSQGIEKKPLSYAFKTPTRIEITQPEQAAA